MYRCRNRWNTSRARRGERGIDVMGSPDPWAGTDAHSVLGVCPHPTRWDQSGLEAGAGRSATQDRRDGAGIQGYR